MVKKFEITILTDKTSWMKEYNTVLAQKLEEYRHSVKLINCIDELKEGDFAFFLSCFEIIKPEKLKLNKHNLVVHASKLPQGKGWSPMSWQILEGKNNIPITLFEASEKVDAGDIYLQDEIILQGSELISEWQKKLGEKIIEMCLSYINNFDSIEAKTQIGEESFYLKRKPSDSELDIKKTIEEQFNLLRIVDNDDYPAFFNINGQKFKLKVEKYD